MFQQLGLIGCGLIGGSFALALRQAGLVRRVVGYSKSPSTTERARQLGVIDAEAPSALQAVAGADLVLLAVPVAATESTLRAIRLGLGEDALVMDVGSTKADVVAAGHRALQQQAANFVPAHPIAGKEVAGVEHADGALFVDRHVILTPTERSRAAHVQRAIEVWSRIGARVQTMTAPAHDAALAAVSHLPHLLAFAFMQALNGQDEGARFLELAGPGFRDFSRIAAGDPTIWRDILLANREQVLHQSQAFREALQRFEAQIADGDAAGLADAIGAASRARAALKPALSG
ncbi:prephenate dehydrogenase [Pseudacidovorax intermedius]|uniref:Prephenate dehydrogenase n=1 Tax=Pseudacidovorax intermedius TaxID=433924 RepID=A0A147GW62_9BURK|nr:prephenate dehydrogenase/arogenate dehydrogenase family protein [Pseudacidovorax intermedius]KTT21824.1 prephenate dehydrogenase [Pseudacidovorax intermedius]